MTDETLKLIGHRWAKASHELKDFLGRNQIPFSWVDLDRGQQGEQLLKRLGMEEAQLPVVAFPDGSVLTDPTLRELAEKLQMHVHAANTYYDLAIVGGGPAGLSAAVYGASEGLSTALLEREAPGGQAGTSSRIENYLGFPEGISGGELAQRALHQATRLGAEIIEPVEVEKLDLQDGYKVLSLSDGSKITAHAVIVATGVAYRALSAPGLDELAGAGVYYGAATTETEGAEGEHVFIVGAGNSAGQGAKYFSRFAEKVSVVIRSSDLTETMSKYLIDQLEETPNIEIVANHHVVEAHGQDHLEALTLEHVETGERSRFETSFLFVFIGAEPRTPWLGDLVARDKHGFLLTGFDLSHGDLADWPLDRQPLPLETNVPGIFAAGDIRHGSIRRVAGAVGEGSTCVRFVHKYLAG